MVLRDFWVDHRPSVAAMTLSILYSILIGPNLKRVVNPNTFVSYPYGYADRDSDDMNLDCVCDLFDGEPCSQHN